MESSLGDLKLAESQEKFIKGTIFMLRISHWLLTTRISSVYTSSYVTRFFP
jgi:hypothetical protein